MRASTVLGVGWAVCTALACGDPAEDGQGPRWTLTGAMQERRMTHTATVLPSGLVLVAGGMEDLPVLPVGVQWDSLSSAEIYDPAVGTWTPTGAMQSPRSRHAAFLMSSGPYLGKVLVVGGCAGFEMLADHHFHCRPLRTTELYDPATGQWEPGPELPHPPGYWNVVELADGKLLAAGTLETLDALPGAASQLFDPVTSTWTVVGSMNVPRVHQRMVLLETGEVLAVGGTADWDWPDDVSEIAELYDPVRDRWSITTTPPAKRVREVLVRLPGGRVLRAGGCGNAGWFCAQPPFTPTSQAWIYERSTETWRETSPMHYPHVYPASVLLDSGQVLVAGGNWVYGLPARDYYPSPTPEVFEPATETWATTRLMPHYVMGGGAMVKLPSGSALFTGGYVNGVAEANFMGIPSAQVYR